MKQPVCKINKSPIKVGSILRNSGNGARLVKAMFKLYSPLPKHFGGELGTWFICHSYGNVVNGVLTLSKQPKAIHMFIKPDQPYIACRPSHNGLWWEYVNVTTQFKSIK